MARIAAGATAPETTAQASRPKRTPLSKRDKLSVKNRDPNYVYRVVNVVDTRVEDFQEQGYTFATSAEVGDKRVDSASPMGSTGQLPVGKGIRAVVMKIHKDYYHEDQDYKQKQIDELEATMQGTAKKGF